MTIPPTIRPLVAASLIVLATAALSGCMRMTEIARMPGLAEARPTGPEGKKCFDRCSQAHAACREMCPKNEGGCQEDCGIDTKFCLADCPELQNLMPAQE